MPSFVDAILKRRGLRPMERCIFMGTAEGHSDFTRNIERQVKRICRGFGAMSLTGYPAKNGSTRGSRSPT
jgi:alkyldihydroxyacetonephosphate synthase